MEQCLTTGTSGGKTCKKKNWESKVGPNGPKWGLKSSFLSFFQVWFISFPVNCIDDSFEHCLTASRGKAHKKTFGSPNLVQN